MQSRRPLGICFASGEGAVSRLGAQGSHTYALANLCIVFVPGYPAGRIGGRGDRTKFSVLAASFFWGFWVPIVNIEIPDNFGLVLFHNLSFFAECLACEPI